MGMIDRIKSAVGRLKPKPKPPAPQPIAIQIVPAQPPPQSRDERLQDRVAKQDSYARRMFGRSKNIKSTTSTEPDTEPEPIRTSPAYQSQAHKSYNTYRSMFGKKGYGKQPGYVKKKVVGAVKTVTGKATTIGHTIATANKQRATANPLSNVINKTQATVNVVGKATRATYESANQSWDIVQDKTNLVNKALGGKDMNKVKRIYYGSKISKKERKELEKKYGSNWRKVLRRGKTRGYYTQATTSDYAQARRERQLTAGAVNFGEAFSGFDNGIGVPLTSDRARVPFVKRADDPYDIDAQFSGANSNIGVRKPADSYDVDSKFRRLKL